MLHLPIVKELKNGIKLLTGNRSISLTEPGLVISPEFQLSLKHPEVARFMADFQYWNQVALPIMNQMSKPYQSLQQDLVLAMGGKVGRATLDFGSGLGSIIASLIRKGEDPSQVFALDPDLVTLFQVPVTLSKVGFRGELVLAHSSSMVPLPIDSESIDSIISGLGGVTYSGFYFHNGNVVEGPDALFSCLNECHRVLKKDGYLGLSSLVPNPDFKRIKWQSIWSLIFGLRLAYLLVGIANTSKIERASRFMHACAEAGKVHYLSVQRWKEVLSKSGFRVVKVKQGSYVGQGLVVVAKRL